MIGSAHEPLDPSGGTFVHRRVPIPTRIYKNPFQVTAPWHCAVTNLTRLLARIAPLVSGLWWLYANTVAVALLVYGLSRLLRHVA